ncbi:hypothetical protein ACIHCM_10565 [Streptomyces sp. NPDC052023]|uniref:hypothetical protein n=1 Tax=Streptomyces sp. NPDC052023 TaxID=3365681 RepID=UPI0037D734F9
MREWSDVVVASTDVGADEDTTERDRAGEQARAEMGQYLVNLAEQRRGKPGDDMLSAFVNEPDPALRLTQGGLAETAVLLLNADYETTVNLITNGVLSPSCATRNIWTTCAVTPTCCRKRWNHRCTCACASRTPTTVRPVLWHGVIRIAAEIAAP